MKKETAISRAVRLAGGPGCLANHLNESIQTVCNWVARGKAPANRCPAIEALTGVSRRELRPDDWGDYWPELTGEAAPDAEAKAA